MNPFIDLSGIPQQFGVYLMKDEQGHILYIGKAKNLKKRLSSYFQKNHPEAKTRFLVARIHKVDFIVTQSEAEAFLLEDHLVKQYKPQYNIQLKDNKSYPFVAIDANELFPRIYKTRETHRRGVKYYGPYPHSAVADYLVKIAHKYFKLRICSYKIRRPEKQSRKGKPCLYYHIGKCPGYCLWKVSEENYEKRLQRFIRFLSGKYSALERELKQEMDAYSSSLEFEKAAEIRDLLTAVEEMKQKQQVQFQSSKDLDAFGYFEKENKIFFTVLCFTEGRLLSKRVFQMEEGLDKEALLTELLNRFYAENPLPDRIYLPFTPENIEEVSEFLEAAKGKKTEILCPSSGYGVSLIRMASQNARYEYLMNEKMTNRELALKMLKEILGMKVEPRRIEAYDIATIEGYWSVGACSAFYNGRPDKKHYRHFSIKCVRGQDDYAMLQETLLRRIRLDNSPLPDLFLIDGGKGQLNAALEVLVRLDLKIPVISLAKKEELIFLPQRLDPIHLDLNDPALQILISARDEVHRFANRLHDKIRMRTIKTSRLEDLPGIGPKRRQKLLQVFGSLENLKKATVTEMAEKAGLPKPLAQKIWEYFHLPSEGEGPVGAKN